MREPSSRPSPCPKSSSMPQTLVQTWAESRKRLTAAGVDQPAIDSRLLLEAAAGVTRTEIVTDPYREVTDEQLAALDGFLDRRSRREPISHILGRKAFWKIMVGVTPAVLTPRADTEVIVDLALKSFGEAQAFTILDLGTGSGAILLAILSERPRAKGVGIDVSDEALAVARENAANLDLDGRLALLRGDWTAGLADASFDLVVSNPPYIRSGEIDDLEPEVRDHEPRLALDGGPDGLDAYRGLAPEILRVLKPGGLLAVEIGHDQSSDVEAMFREAGAADVRTVKDLADRDRVVTGRKKDLGISAPSR